MKGSETWTLLKADERQLEAFHMNCQRRILEIRWFHFVMNASVTSKTGEEVLAIRICRRRLSIFGHVRRLPEATPAHSALCLAVDTHAGGKPDIRPEWKRQRGRPCRTWVQQIEDDTGLNANDAWRIAHDRNKSWKALRPVAGQAFHWLTDWLMTYAKNYTNWWMCIKVIATQTWYIFETQCNRFTYQFNISTYRVVQKTGLICNSCSLHDVYVVPHMPWQARVVRLALPRSLQYTDDIGKIIGTDLNCIVYHNWHNHINISYGTHELGPVSVFTTRVAIGV